MAVAVPILVVVFLARSPLVFLCHLMGLLVGFDAAHQDEFLVASGAAQFLVITQFTHVAFAEAEHRCRFFHRDTERWNRAVSRRWSRGCFARVFTLVHTIVRCGALVRYRRRFLAVTRRSILRHRILG